VEPESDTQSPLFATPIEHFVAQVSWRAGQGWRLWVSSWDVGESPARAHSATYTLLTADEALDVLEAEQKSRCEWLRD
jgi:hypothetical protein